MEVNINAFTHNLYTVTCKALATASCRDKYSVGLRSNGVFLLGVCGAKRGGSYRNLYTDTKNNRLVSDMDVSLKRS